MRTLKIEPTDSRRAMTTIFSYTLWLINLRGLKVLSILNILMTGISTPVIAISIIEEETMKKSS